MKCNYYVWRTEKHVFNVNTHYYMKYICTCVHAFELARAVKVINCVYKSCFGNRITAGFSVCLPILGYICILK